MCQRLRPEIPLQGKLRANSQLGRSWNNNHVWRSVQSRGRGEDEFPKEIGVSSPVGQPAQQTAKVGFPSAVQTEVGKLAEAGGYAGSLAPVQYPVEVGVPFAAQAEDGSPAEAGNHAGRQAAVVASE